MPYNNSYYPNQAAGCMMVPTEDDVQKYPVAPNTVMVFILQDLSACYIKATGSSILDAPRIQKYNREAPPQQQEVPTNNTNADYASKSDLEQMQRQIDTLNNQIKPLLNRNPNNNKKADTRNE